MSSPLVGTQHLLAAAMATSLCAHLGKLDEAMQTAGRLSLRLEGLYADI